MRKYLLILAAFVLASSLSLGAQSLTDNPSYQKSLELKAMASQAFDDGDYDSAAEYATQAKQYASLSDQYVAKMLAKSQADRAISQATAKMAWATNMNAKTLYPEQYGAASDQYSAALASYASEDFPGASDNARLTVEAVDAIALTDADAAMAEAKAKIAWADSIDAKEGYADRYAQATDDYAAAIGAYNSTDYPSAAAKARAAVSAVDAIAVADADAAIAQARAALSAAEAIDGPANYPNEYAEAKGDMSDALAAYDGKDYPTAAQKARACVAALAVVKAKAKVIAWPAVYVVRLIPARRDCLWRIAEYPFIYNNPLKWTVIYEANKKSFRDPGNPNLIFPGQKLKIP